MSEKNYYTPSEILDLVVQAGINKTTLAWYKQIVLGFMAGAFIALAACGSNIAAFNLLLDPKTFGLGKLVAAAVFPAGLILVVLAGGELFTGNSLIFASVLSRKTSVFSMLKNWTFVYAGNVLGSLLVVALVFYSGQLKTASNMLGALSLKTAFNKVSLDFTSAFCLGVLCNFLVCLGVWLSFSAKDTSGKILGCFFPVLLFVVSGFEHSIANMYYVPIGIFAKSVPEIVQASGLTTAQLESVNWTSFLLNNLLPVTLGNIVGGTILVAGTYTFSYGKKAVKP